MSSPLGLINYGNDITYRSSRTMFSGDAFSFVDKKKSSMAPNDHKSEYRSNGIYNTSIPSIIEHCKNYPLMRLKYSDFAYLKNLGVYSNNRLIIARRFTAPVGDDLTNIKGENIDLMSTLISWVPPDDESFFNMTFNEKWTDTDEASFKDILNTIGKGIGGENGFLSKMGDMAESAANVVPLHGFTEGIQLEIMNKLGITDRDRNTIPAGDPNIIKQSRHRQLVGDGKSGSGLESKFQVVIKTEYEQKFIKGVDPTSVFLDVIGNALRFGTSESTFYLNSNFANSTSKFLNNLKEGKLWDALKEMVSALGDVIGAVADKIIETLTNPPSDPEGGGGIISAISDLIKAGVTTIINKYFIKLTAIVQALTGEPSGCWHVTMGNPKWPTFVSGDMVCDSVKVDFGNIMAFNDMPSNIKIEATLSPARNLGAQELFQKFVAGRPRTYTSIKKGYYENFKREMSAEEKAKLDAQTKAASDKYNEEVAKDKKINDYAKTLDGDDKTKYDKLSRDDKYLVATGQKSL